MGVLKAALAKLRGQRAYLDTNTLVYFFDRNPAYFTEVAEIIQACDRGEFFGFTGDAAVSELMVHPYQSRNPAEIARGKAFFARPNFITVLPHTTAIFDTASQFRATGKNLKLIDALHYATAIAAGCRFFITNDKDFGTISADVAVINLQSLMEAKKATLK
jgi:predicted nucleic acid-binding protein